MNFQIDVINKLKELVEILKFQERRNFFNSKEDIYLEPTSKIVDTLLEKIVLGEFNTPNTIEALNILIKMLLVLEKSDKLECYISELRTFIGNNM